jgi:SET domain-containing protein
MDPKPKKLAVKRTRTGLGLFVLEPIQAGRRIVEYRGKLVSTRESHNLSGMYLFEVDKHRIIDGSERGNIARYINHSCEPNSIAYSSGSRVWIWSKEAIKPGSAITIDYGQDYFEQYIKPKGCKCEKCKPA